MAEVVLVYPRSSYIETAMSGQYPPLALMQAALFVEKEFKVKIIDQRTNKRWDKELRDTLGKDTLCVGLTALTGEMINHALEISRIVKESSRVPVIWGGIHPTILPEQTLNSKYIDMVIIGEGEVSFHELVKALRDKRQLDEIPGLGYKKNGKIKINPLGELLNLDDLPDPPYHLIDIDRYKIKFHRKDMFVLETSRGCPYRCSFCYSKSFDFKKRYRYLSAEKTVNRLRKIKENFNIDGIELIDDNFLVNSPRAKEILSRAADEKLDIFLNINGRVDDIFRLDNGNMDLFERSNVWRLAIGVESGSQRILDMIQKGIKVEDILEFKRRIDKTRVPPYYNFIGGLVNETEGDLRKTTRLMLELLKGNKRAKVSIFHCFRPLPGTKLMEECVKNGLTEPGSLEEWSKYSMTYIDHPWITPRLRRKIKMLNFVSLFLDKKYEEVDSVLVRIFAWFYRPIAHWRMRNLSTFGFVEDYLLKLYEKMKR